MAQRSAGSCSSIIDGREYEDRLGLFSYGSGVVEVPMCNRRSRYVHQSAP